MRLGFRIDEERKTDIHIRQQEKKVFPPNETFRFQMRCARAKWISEIFSVGNSILRKMASSSNGKRKDAFSRLRHYQGPFLPLSFGVCGASAAG